METLPLLPCPRQGETPRLSCLYQQRHWPYDKRKNIWLHVRSESPRFFIWITPFPHDVIGDVDTKINWRRIEVPKKKKKKNERRGGRRSSAWISHSQSLDSAGSRQETGLPGKSLFARSWNTSDSPITCLTFWGRVNKTLIWCLCIQQW